MIMLGVFKDHEGQELNIQDKDKVDNNSRTETYQDTVSVPGLTVDICNKANSNAHKCNASVVSGGTLVANEQVDNST